MVKFLEDTPDAGMASLKINLYQNKILYDKVIE